LEQYQTYIICMLKLQRTVKRGGGGGGCCCCCCCCRRRRRRRRRHTFYRTCNMSKTIVLPFVHVSVKCGILL